MLPGYTSADVCVLHGGNPTSWQTALMEVPALEGTRGI